MCYQFRILSHPQNNSLSQKNTQFFLLEGGSFIVIFNTTYDLHYRAVVLQIKLRKILPGRDWNMARSSRAIWEGPSSPMETPAWEPTTLMLV